MNTHNAVKSKLYEFLRNELSEADRRNVETHLASCTRCAEELAALRRATAMLDQHVQKPSDRRSGMYWQMFADKVEARLEEESNDTATSSILRKLLDALLVNRMPFGVGFASALTLVMLVFGIWSLWLRNPASLPVEQSTRQEVTSNGAGYEKAALDLRAQDYLEQSKVLLIGLMNTDITKAGASRPLFQREREISRKLVSESGDLTSKLNDPSQRRLKELISDLQLILVQIANLEARGDVQGLEIIKGGIRHNDVLFKINLEEIQRTTQSAPANARNGKRSI